MLDPMPSIEAQTVQLATRSVQGEQAFPLNLLYVPTEHESQLLLAALQEIQEGIN